MAGIACTFHPIPTLDRPIFILAFGGLFDMGEAATRAVDWLSMTHNGVPAAEIDPEELFDFQETRPTVQVGANGVREIHWPTNNAVVAQTPPGSRDLVLLSGVEPNLRWRAFGESILSIVDYTRAELVVTLGSALGTVPHSRSFPVNASTGDPLLADRLGVSPPTYEGPTGLVGSLHQQLAEREFPSLSLRVAVPHYVPGPPSPKATAALLAQLETICGIPTQHAGLADDIRDWEMRVHRAMSDDEDVRGYVEQLEAEADAEPTISLADSDIAAEIEKFLSERDED